MATGHTPSRRHPEYWGGDIPWINVGDARIVDGSVIHTTNECTNPLGIENSAAVVLPAGTVCLSRTGSIGYAIVLGREMATSQGFVNWVCGDSLLPRFLQLLFLAERSFLHEISEGVAHTTIYFPEAKAFHICIPPIDVQGHIAERVDSELSRVTQGVEALTRVRANLKRYRAAVLKAACEGTLVPTEADLARAEGRDYETGEQLLERVLTARRENWTGKGKYKEPEPMKTAACGTIPKGWAWATVVQLTEANRACAYGVLQPGKDCAHGIPLVRVGDINSGKVDTSQLKQISPAIAARYPRTSLRGGELLISLVGAIGRTAVAPPSLAGANTARAVGVIPLAKMVDAAFVEIWFRNPAKIATMTSQAHEVARKTLNLEDVRAATVALPPLAEQHRIVAEVERRLSVIDELDTLVDTNLARAGRLRQSILAKAFSGELVSASGDGAAPPQAPRKRKGPPSGGPKGRPTAGKGPVQSSTQS